MGAKSKNLRNGRCVERPSIPSDAFVASAGAVRCRERALFWAKLSRPAHTRNLEIEMKDGPKKFRELLAKGGLIVAPGVYDGYSARLVEKR